MMHVTRYIATMRITVRQLRRLNGEFARNMNDPNVGCGIIIHIGKQGTVATRIFRRN